MVYSTVNPTACRDNIDQSRNLATIATFRTCQCKHHGLTLRCETALGVHRPGNRISVPHRKQWTITCSNQDESPTTDHPYRSKDAAIRILFRSTQCPSDLVISTVGLVNPLSQCQSVITIMFHQSRINGKLQPPSVDRRDQSLLQSWTSFDQQLMLIRTIRKELCF